jgi:hypothetical protein
MVLRLRPLAETLLGCLTEGVYAPSHKGEQWKTHGLPFTLELKAMILPQSEGLGHISRTDENIRPAQATTAALKVLGVGRLLVGSLVLKCADLYKELPLQMRRPPAGF